MVQSGLLILSSGLDLRVMISSPVLGSMLHMETTLKNIFHEVEKWLIFLNLNTWVQVLLKKWVLKNISAQSKMVTLKKNTEVIISFAKMKWTFVSEVCLYVKERKRLINKLVIQTWVSDRHFLEKEQTETVTSKKTTDSICCQTHQWELNLNTPWRTRAQYTLKASKKS